MQEKLKITKNDGSTASSFTDIVDVTYLTPENSVFSVSEHGFLQLVSTVDAKPEKLFDEEDGTSPAPSGGPGPGGHSGPPAGGPPAGNNGSGGGYHGGRGHRGGAGHKPKEPKYTDDGRRDYGRVILHRAFPFDSPETILSVQDEMGLEIGIIRSITDFDEAAQAMLRHELDQKYFVPEILTIDSVKDRFGFVYFTCTTDHGKCSFVVRNVFANIIRVSDTHIFIVDIDGNRYSIADLSSFDRKSYRKIELYL